MSCAQIEIIIAAGEALGAGEQAHLAGCADCRALLAVREQSAAALGGRAVEPGPGFEARLVAGAHARRAPRRRLWLAALAPALALVAGLYIGRGGARRDAPPAPPAAAAPVAPADPDDVRVVAQVLALADWEQSLRVGADWERALAPLAPIRRLMREESP